MEEIIQFDKHLLLMLNGSDSLYLDGVVLTLTKATTWIPLYFSLLYLTIKNSISWRPVLLVIAAAGLCVLLAGTVDDEIVKPLVARWRPTHDPQIGSLVDVANGYRGGNYGFFSAHASNTFSIALFFSLLFRNRWLTCGLVTYSLINCWTRLYLGVHYPGDITVGLLWGAIVGFCVYRLFCYAHKKLLSTDSSQFTLHSTQYLVPLVVLALTFLYAFIRGWLIMDTLAV